MLENIIYHTIILIFLVIVLVYLFRLHKKNQDFETALIPFFLTKEFELPRQRSLFVRGLSSIEYFLSEKFGVAVRVEYDKSRHQFTSKEFEIFSHLLFFEKNFSSDQKLSSLCGFSSDKKIKVLIFKQLSDLQLNSATDNENRQRVNNWEIRVL